MFVSVDSGICQGHARCWAICPEVFQLDDEGHAIVVAPQVPPEQQQRAREAARNCPERAISVT